MSGLKLHLKGAVYTVWIFICICMSLRVFLFAKKMFFFTKGGIHCISQVFLWHFYFMREHSLVELTEHDDSATNIIVHSICMVITYSRVWINRVRLPILLVVS